MRIILLAGGSGGHISPAFAIASEFRKELPSAHILFFCSRNPLDISFFQSSQERYIPIFSGKIRRYFSFQNFIDPFLLLLGIFQCLFLFLRKRPDIVFSKGGFVAIPGCIAAWILRIPVFAHESDAVSGIATRLCQKFAKQIFTTFPEKKGIHTGTPIRSEILKGNRERGRKFLEFSGKKQILLGIGGSQGSKFLNTLLESSADELLKMLDIVWITGAGSEKIITPRFGLRIFPFLGTELPDVLAVADLVVSRSGSNFLFELAVLGKPMLLIPLATAAGDHQTQNARIFSENKAAQVLLEKDAPRQFLKEVTDLFSDQHLRKTLGENAKKMATTNAAEQIVTKVLQNFSKE